MSKIFISYRRDDSADVTGRIGDRLRDHFGDENVFTDVDDIPLGVDFRKHLDDAVRQCDVLLAVIGRTWSSVADEAGNQRLIDPTDFVRIEIESALDRGIPVVPLLVQGADMPKKEQLPATLESLAFQNAQHVRRDPDFKNDMYRLIAGLVKHLGIYAEVTNENIDIRLSAGPPDPAKLEPPPDPPSDASWASQAGEDQYGHWCEFDIHGVTQRMRWIPPGKFLMGSPEDEPERNDDERLHPVKLTEGYWLAETACTQALWEAVLGEDPSALKGSDRPVELVSWNDAKRFIEQVNERLPGLCCRLPTEAQWEYAARAGTQTPFWWGSTLSPEQANYDGDQTYANGEKGEYRRETVAVKHFEPNPWGLYQVHGNVWSGAKTGTGNTDRQHM